MPTNHQPGTLLTARHHAGRFGLEVYGSVIRLSDDGRRLLIRRDWDGQDFWCEFADVICEGRREQDEVQRLESALQSKHEHVRYQEIAE